MRQLDGRQIVVASHNKGKIAEFAQLIEPFGFDARSAADYDLPEPEETGTTFEENALIKALAAAKATSLVALSDDSGICINVLDGAPGVYTANWAERPGGGRDFVHAMQITHDKLMEKNAADPQSRTARFVSVICLAWPDGHHEFFRGEVEGTLVWPPRGQKGFGYDPMFQPEGFDITFGEMEADQKHGWKPGDAQALSHRARAFKRFAEAKLSQT